MSAAHRVMAEAEAFDDTGGNRDDVLSAPPISTPATSSVAHSAATARGTRWTRHAASAEATPPRPPSAARPRPPPRTSGPTAPPPDASDRPRRRSPGHRIERAVLEAFAALTNGTAAGRRDGPCTTARRPCDGTATTTSVAALRHPRSKWWDGRPRRGDAGQIVGARAPRRDGRRARRPGPTGARRVRGAPGARPVRCPSSLPRERRWCAFKWPASARCRRSRVMLAWCFSTMIAATAAAASVTNAGSCHAAVPTSASVAASEPSDTSACSTPRR